MANDAWSDDPAIRMGSDDDPDSQKVKAWLIRWVWPGIGGLAIVVLIVSVMKLSWTYGVVQVAAGVWLIAQLVIRPGAFLLSVRNAFGNAARLFADLLAPGVRLMNRRDEPKPAEVRCFMPQATLDTEAPPAAPMPPAQQSKPKRTIDWLAALDGLLKFWWLIPVALIAWALLSFGGRVLDYFDGPSGREVAAEARAANAESEQRTSTAEVHQREETIAILERHQAQRAHVRVQVEAARETIAAAPDLDARYAAYRDLSDRLRNESRTAAAAAVREYRAGLAAEPARSPGPAEPR